MLIYYRISFVNGNIWTEVSRSFHPRLCQTKDFKIGTWSVSAITKHFRDNLGEFLAIDWHTIQGGVIILHLKTYYILYHIGFINLFKFYVRLHRKASRSDNFQVPNLINNKISYSTWRKNPGNKSPIWSLLSRDRYTSKVHLHGPTIKVASSQTPLFSNKSCVLFFK